MKNKLNLLFLVLATIFLITGGLISSFSDTKFVITECRDRSGNEIVELTCKKNIMADNFDKYTMGIFIGLGVLFALASIIIR